MAKEHYRYTITLVLNASCATYNQRTAGTHIRRLGSSLPANRVGVNGNVPTGLGL